MVAQVADADTGQRRRVSALPVAPGGQRPHMQSHAGQRCRRVLQRSHLLLLLLLVCQQRAHSRV